MKHYWIELIDDFLEYKYIHCWLSNETIRTYVFVFNSFLESELFDFNDFSTFTEANFLKCLKDNLINKKWSSRTYNKMRKNLKVFCDYLIMKWKLTANPLEKITYRNTEKNLPKYLTRSQINILQRTIEKVYKCDNVISIRNKTIMYFYLFSWLRLSELTHLKLEDISFENNTIRVNKGKWWKDRVVPLISILKKKLKIYLSTCHKHKIDIDILFPTRFWNCLQHRDIYNIFNKVRAKLSFRFTPHMCRHTFATTLINNDVPIYNVQKAMWHTDIKTTEIYVCLDMNNFAKKLNKLKLFKPCI